MAGSGAVTRIPGAFGAHSSRRDAQRLRPVPCAASRIVGSSFGPETPPESSSDHLGFRPKLIRYGIVSYFSTHSESGSGYNSMQSKLHTANCILAI